ncbi:MAG: polyprenyl synthetase family protein [Bacteroidota bacterium]
MEDLSQIRKPIAEQLELFDSNFKQTFKSNIFLLNKVTQYILKTKGKQVRPLLVFLSAGVCGNINESTHRAASMIEMLHTATLIHDDVVDDSNERRGFFSINALWKNKIAVLVGDFLLSKGLLLALDNNEHQLLSIVADATRQMSEGELLQIEKARHLDIEEDIYFEIIQKKTASLFAACTASGAASSGADKERVDLMYQFGLNLGIAFQIKDDLFDFQQKNETGKPSGIDIKEKKLTLPIIFLLNKSSYLEKKKIIYSIKKNSNKPETVQKLIQQVNESGGIDYAHEKMISYRDKALSVLLSMPVSESRNSLEQLVLFTTNRKS